MRLLRFLPDHPRLTALLGASCIAFSGILYRYAAVPPSTATLFRCLYGLPILAAVAWYEHRRFGGLPRRSIGLAVIAGAFFAGDLTFWHHAVDAVGAGLATVLGNLQVLVVGLMAWVLFRERPSGAVLAALPVVLVGIFLISGVVDEGAYGENPTLGVVLGLLTAVCYGAYLLVIRRAGDARRTAGPVAVSTLSTALVAGLVGAPLGELTIPSAAASHGWLLVYGLTSQSAGYLLISLSLPRLPAVLTSIILLAQPVMTMALGIVLLAEAPSALQVLGVALVIGGIAVATVPLGRVRDALATAAARLA